MHQSLAKWGTKTSLQRKCNSSQQSEQDQVPPAAIIRFKEPSLVSTVKHHFGGLLSLHDKLNYSSVDCGLGILAIDWMQRIVQCPLGGDVMNKTDDDCGLQASHPAHPECLD